MTSVRSLVLCLGLLALPLAGHADESAAALPPAIALTPTVVAPPAVVTPTVAVPPAAAALPLVPVVKAACRPGPAGPLLRSARVEWRVSPCGGGLQDIRLLEPQFKMAARVPPTGVAEWAKYKFAAGPLDLVETWDARWDPFRDELLELQLPSLQLAVRKGQTVEAMAVASLPALYKADRTWGVLASSATEVVLAWPDPARVRSPVYLWKRFTPAGADRPYDLRVELALWNVGGAPAQFRIAHEISTFQDPATAASGGIMAMFAGPPEHKGAGFSYGETTTRFDSTELAEPDEKHAHTGVPEWLGVDSRYFLLASVPIDGYAAAAQAQGQDLTRLQHLANGVVLASLQPVGGILPALTATGCVPDWYASQWGGTACGAESKSASVKTWKYEIYSGPKDMDDLKAANPNLVGSVDFGWFGLIGKPMLWVLKQAHGLANSWPLAILLLTILVKALLWPITAKSIRSMRGMQKIKPALDKAKAELEAKAKAGGKDKADPADVNRVTMELYKQHGVNPLGGCLPMLLQLPVYIALYRTIQSSVGLFNQPLFGWISDMTQKDPYYVLPLVLGVVMFAQQKLTPQVGGDPAQQKMLLYFMPILFTVMMLQLPSGLTLYILANTVLGIAQTLYTNREVKAAPA